MRKSGNQAPLGNRPHRVNRFDSESQRQPENCGQSARIRPGLRDSREIVRPRKAPRTPESSRCRSPPRSGQSQPAPSTEAPPVDEQRSTKSARAKVLGKNSQKGPPAGKRAKKERTGGGSPRRPRAFWGPGAAFWGFLGAWGAVGKKAGNGPNRTRLIEIGLQEEKNRKKEQKTKRQKTGAPGKAKRATSIPP